MYVTDYKISNSLNTSVTPTYKRYNSNTIHNILLVVVYVIHEVIL